jgi:hypothetical protein
MMRHKWIADGGCSENPGVSDNGKMMHTITLYRTESGWVARDNDPAVRRLFGTDTLPTPFPPSVPAETVRNQVARLNPDTVVRLSGGFDPSYRPSCD